MALCVPIIRVRKIYYYLVFLEQRKREKKQSKEREKRNRAKKKKEEYIEVIETVFFLDKLNVLCLFVSPPSTSPHK